MGGDGFVGAKVRLFLSCGVIELWNYGIMEDAVMRLCGHRGLNLLAVDEDGYLAGA